jgi:hypothetical protein
MQLGKTLVLLHQFQDFFTALTVFIKFIPVMNDSKHVTGLSYYLTSHPPHSLSQSHGMFSIDFFGQMIYTQ